MRHYYDDYDYDEYYSRRRGRGSYYVPPRRRSGSSYGGYGRRTGYGSRYGREQYGGYGYSGGYGRRRGYYDDYGAINDYSRRRRSGYDRYDSAGQYGQYDPGRQRRRQDHSDGYYSDNPDTEGSDLYGGDYDDYDLYGDSPRGGRHAGLVIFLLLALIVIASINISVFHVNRIMKKIDYQTEKEIPGSVFAVSASDINSRLPEDGLTGEQLNDYHLSVYRRQILRSFIDESRLASKDDVTNILFIVGETENSPADIITLITLNSADKKVTFTSVMPETGIAYADIEAPLRLSCASEIGGSLLTVYTVQSLLGVRIDKYVMLDSAGFAEMTDRLGGIRMTLSKAESDACNTYIQMYNSDYPLITDDGSALNGRQAYLLAKFAGAPNDGKTVSRRSELLYETARMLNGASAPALIRAFSAAAPYCHTDLTSKQILSLAWSCKELRHYNVMTDTMPQDSECTVVSVNGKGMMRFNSIDRCRRRLLIGAVGLEEDEAVLEGYVSDSDSVLTDEPVSGSDAESQPE